MFTLASGRTLLAIGLTALATVTAASAAVTPAQAASDNILKPFHAHLDGTFVFGAPCPPDVLAGKVCLTDQVTGTASHLGEVSSTFLVIFDFTGADDNGCVPISKSGRFQAADRRELHVQARGTYCPATGIAQYEYTFTGGSGKFAHATGSGTWLVPPPSTFDPGTGQGTGPEELDGTINY